MFSCYATVDKIWINKQINLWPNNDRCPPSPTIPPNQIIINHTRSTQNATLSNVSNHNFILVLDSLLRYGFQLTGFLHHFLIFGEESQWSGCVGTARGHGSTLLLTQSIGDLSRTTQSVTDIENRKKNNFILNLKFYCIHRYKNKTHFSFGLSSLYGNLPNV